MHGDYTIRRLSRPLTTTYNVGDSDADYGRRFQREMDDIELAEERERRAKLAKAVPVPTDPVAERAAEFVADGLATSGVHPTFVHGVRPVRALRKETAK